MNAKNTINREHFEAWLFSQPDDRRFEYLEGQPSSLTGCVVCNFLREQTNITTFGVSGSQVGFRTSLDFDYIPFEPWLQNLLLELANPVSFDAKRAKAMYISLFPNAIVGSTQPSTNVEKVEPSSIAQATNGSLTNVEFAIQTIK